MSLRGSETTEAIPMKDRCHDPDIYRGLAMTITIRMFCHRAIGECV
jgi:hypothetical protein